MCKTNGKIKILFIREQGADYPLEGLHHLLSYKFTHWFQFSSTICDGHKYVSAEIIP